MRLADERACERLITRYTHLVDFGEAPAIADLFTADGVWRTDEFAMRGRDEIRAGFERRQGVTRRLSRHVCTNMLIDVDGDTATGLCYLVNYRHDSGTGEAEYRDRFVRTPDGWRFAERYCEMAFVRPSRRTGS